ncbi:ankyrin repeat domain-containing protein [Aureispira sp. CCB-QB1]|uniref:ankyrin repeat domain-containing protein n=1 Tax=Aureispira sp. CCB-QB1 TaxID=1313421 RepID=UPI0006962765|nr:ankyrin repeat domain-containing protein [Aureispira sp. CCB-QB1]
MASNLTSYNLVIHALRQGSTIDWIKLAKKIHDFPNGCDAFIGRRWITNAIDCGSFQSIVWMLSQEVDLNFVDEEGYSVLHSCIDRYLPSKYTIMQLLIDYNAPIDIGTKEHQLAVNGWSPLHMAVARKDIQAVRLLLKNGANTTLRTCIDNYATAREEARYYGYLDIAALL